MRSFAPLLLSLERQCSSTLRFFVGLARGFFYARSSLRWPFLDLGNWQVLRQSSVFGEGAKRSHWTLENNAWFRHGRGNNRRIMRLFRKPLLEKISPRAPGLSCRLHRWRCDSQIEEP